MIFAKSKKVGTPFPFSLMMHPNSEGPSKLISRTHASKTLFKIYTNISFGSPVTYGPKKKERGREWVKHIYVFFGFEF